jgi:hypothetical protein
MRRGPQCYSGKQTGYQHLTDNSIVMEVLGGINTIVHKVYFVTIRYGNFVYLDNTQYKNQHKEKGLGTPLYVL